MYLKLLSSSKQSRCHLWQCLLLMSKKRNEIVRNVACCGLDKSAASSQHLYMMQILFL
jgi:hypothetical protein